MNTVLISVIVPCYDQAQYLDECLQSVLDQTYENWECIIVNDGSPDHTEEVALRWTARDARFKYVKKENGGLSSARNAGIEVARGEWILPLDCDDKIGKQYLELAEKEFDKGYTVIYCEAEYFGDRTGRWELEPFSRQNLARTNVIFCSALYKREDWQKVDGYDTQMRYGLEDWEFWISILKTSGNAYKIPFVCFYYRIKENSMIESLHRSSRKEEMLFHIEKKHIGFFHDQLGSIHQLTYQCEKKTDEVQQLKTHISKILSSRRYQVADKLLNFFGR